jgi:hypothetical protein
MLGFGVSALFDATACWQYLVRSREERTCENKFAGILASDTYVRRIGYDVARRFIERYEWLGNVGSAQMCFGLFFGTELLSVCCYTKAVAPGAFRVLLPKVESRNVYQLCRGATAPHAPKWSGSRLIGRSLAVLNREVGVQYVFAYADPRAGEIGVIYQAANAIYLGMTDARGPGEYVVCGQRLNPRTVFRRYGSAKHDVLSRVDPSYARVQRVKKHRYVFVLGGTREKEAALAALTHLRRPAPKRYFG